MLAGGLALAALIVAVSFLRRRWMFRGRRHDLSRFDDRGPGLLAAMLPGATPVTVQTGHGPVLAVSHPNGLTAIVRPRTAVADLAAGPDFTVQTVFHVGARHSGPPRRWLAVTVPRSVAVPADEDLAVLLRNALRRVRRRVGGIEPLPRDAVLAALTAVAHVSGGRDQLREDWRYWRTGHVAQACFVLHGWADVVDARRGPLVSTLLSRTPGVAVTVTVDAPGQGAVLRLAATTEEAVDSAAGHLALILSEHDVHLKRLDGSHFRGAAASLPIGGFLQ